MTCGHYRDQIASALRALAIESMDAYRWLGGRYRAERPDLSLGETPREALVASVGACLYRNFYSPGVPRPERPAAERPRAVTGPFVDALSKANSTAGSWESGWTIQAVTAGEIVVRRDGLELFVPLPSFEVDEEPPRPGQPARVLLPKERLGISPGYYVALGAADQSRLRDALRLYFNIDAGGAPLLVAAVTRNLNALEIPFRLKLLVDPAWYGRCDAGVLFVPRREFRALAGLLRVILVELDGALGSGVPALTKPLAPGLACAEDPLGDSFGAHRCRLLAAAAVHSFENDERRLADKLFTVIQTLVAAGLSPDAPYLQPGSNGDYRL
jgi:HopA1 effector protein family